jgi:hypothetical protein
MSEPSVEQLRERLLQSFDDYHSSIRKQTQLLDALIDAVRREERGKDKQKPGATANPHTGILGLLERAVRG